MKKQTAVDWLINILITENEVVLKGENFKIFELAKEMEKEQMLNFARYAIAKAINEDIQNPFNLEQHYNETYGK